MARVVSCWWFVVCWLLFIFPASFSTLEGSFGTCMARTSVRAFVTPKSPKGDLFGLCQVYEQSKL